MILRKEHAEAERGPLPIVDSMIFSRLLDG